MGQRILLIVIFLISFGVSGLEAAETLDIQAELSRPGVKLVVVEFYATWCEPCMKAVPKWKKLHDKYGPKGLRFIVVSVGDSGQCSNPGWSPDRNICDVDGAIQDKWNVADLPQAFLYSWQGDLLAERAHAESVEESIERFFKKSQLRLVVDEVDVIGDKYATSSNPAWLKKYIVAEIRQHSKYDIIKYRNLPSYVRPDKCLINFPANSNLRIQLQGDERGNRTLTLEIEKDGCVLASSQKPYHGKGFNEDHVSLKEAATLAVNEVLVNLINIKNPQPAQVYERAGFGQGLNSPDNLQIEKHEPGVMSRLELPKDALNDFDTNYMDLIVAAGKVDEDSSSTIESKIEAWRKVVAYSERSFAREKAIQRIQEWKDWRSFHIKNAVSIKKAHDQYNQDMIKLKKILSYPEGYVSADQKRAYENEFNRAYQGVKDEISQVVDGTHKLMLLIQDEQLMSSYSSKAYEMFSKSENDFKQYKSIELIVGKDHLNKTDWNNLLIKKMKNKHDAAEK